MAGVGLVGHGEAVAGADPAAGLGGAAGSLVWVTVISTSSPASIGTAGVTTRSSPLPVYSAGRPSTVTAETVPWVKSRLSRSRSAVARASIRVTAARGLVLTPG